MAKVLRYVSLLGLHKHVRGPSSNGLLHHTTPSGRGGSGLWVFLFLFSLNKFNSDPFERELNCSKAKTVQTSKQSLTNFIWVISFGCSENWDCSAMIFYLIRKLPKLEIEVGDAINNKKMFAPIRHFTHAS
jgi:hypothetical protein